MLKAELLFFAEYWLVISAEPRSERHKDERNEEGDGRNFAEDEQRKSCTNEGSNRIVRARSCGAENPLRVNVEEDAQSVCNESDAECREDA